MAVRIALLAMGVSGCFAAGLAFLPWYAADLPSGRETLSGVGASGDAWSVPVAGGLAVAVALALLLRLRGGRTVGTAPIALVVVAAAVGAFWAIWNALAVPALVTVAVQGGESLTVAPGLVAMDLRPAAPLAAAACCLAALSGLVALLGEGS